MVNMKRNKRTLYLCKKYIEDNITQYKEPEEIKINYMPITSNGEMIAIGNEYSQYLKLTGTPEVCSKFSNGDRCYVFVQVPEDDEMREYADFQVYGQPLITINEGNLILKRLTGDMLYEAD